MSNDITQPRPAFGPDDRLITMLRLLELVPFSRVHIYRLIDRGEFPPQVQLGERRVAWIESEVIEWIARRVAARHEPSTPEQGNAI